MPLKLLHKWNKPYINLEGKLGRQISAYLESHPDDSEEFWYTVGTDRITAPWLADSQSRDLNNGFWLDVY